MPKFDAVCINSRMMYFRIAIPPRMQVDKTYAPRTETYLRAAREIFPDLDEGVPSTDKIHDSRAEVRRLSVSWSLPRK